MTSLTGLLELGIWFFAKGLVIYDVLFVLSYFSLDEILCEPIWTHFPNSGRIRRLFLVDVFIATADSCEELKLCSPK